MIYEDQASVFSWIARVPSPSNPADLPSRKLLTKWCFRGHNMVATDVRNALKRCFSDCHHTFGAAK